MVENKPNSSSSSGLNATIAWLKAHQRGETKDSATTTQIFKRYAAVGKSSTIDYKEIFEPDHRLYAASTKPSEHNLSPEEVTRQLEHFENLEKKMKEADQECHSGSSVFNTIQWLKAHEAKAPSPSSSFLSSIVQFISGSPTETEAVVEPSVYKVQDLTSPWGLATMKKSWNELMFAILNEPFHVDMMNARKVILSDQLLNAKPEALASLASWLISFNEQLKRMIEIKGSFLEECSIQTEKGFRLTTNYEQYRRTLDDALILCNRNRDLFGQQILSCFVELEACLKDEQDAISELFQVHMTETQMYEAISNFFHDISDASEGGMVYAKLFAWMCVQFPTEERHAFLHALRTSARQKLGGLWMRYYASYLNLLHDFDIEFQSSVIYSRSIAEVTH